MLKGIILVIISTWSVWQTWACNRIPGQPANVKACDNTGKNIGRSDYEAYQAEDGQKPHVVPGTVYVEVVVTVDDKLFEKPSYNLLLIYNDNFQNI